MESLPLSQTQHTSFGAQVESPQRNRYEVLNCSELAESEKSKAKWYKVKAYACMALGLLVFAGAITTTALLISNPITATIAATLVFIFGLQVYNSLVKNKLFTYYRTLQSEAEAQAAMYEGYAQSIQKVAELNPTLSPAEQNLKGLSQYWIDTATGAKAQIARLSEEIGRLQTFLAQTHLDPKNRGRIEDEIQMKLDKRHELQEGALLSARVHAAYFEHLYTHKEETRREEDFLTFHPISSAQANNHQIANQMHAMTFQPTVREPSYLVLNNAPSLHFTRQEIETLPIPHLSIILFGRQKAA
ncbi:MAG: hypothetical protein KDK64_06020 [Chlamydiia bacterium]|nr:hypothetical protein [Chlamydiia bacterium]